MCDCCDPTSPSTDPVVVRLERELDEAVRLMNVYAKSLVEADASLADRVAEVERLAAHAEFHRNESDRWMQLYHIRGETIEKMGAEIERLNAELQKRIGLQQSLDEIYTIGKLSGELEQLRRGFYVLSGSLRDGHRIAWLNGRWRLFDFNCKCVESEHTLELLVKKLGGEA